MTVSPIAGAARAGSLNWSSETETPSPIRTRVRTIEPRKLTSSIAPLQPVRAAGLADLDRLGPDGDGHAAARLPVAIAFGVRIGLARHAHRFPSAASTTLGGQEVEGPDERGHERRRREVVDLGRWADLLDPALAHHDDPVGQRHRLLLVVGHVHRRDPELALDRPDLLAQGDPDLRVERGQRLVEEEDLGLDREGAGQRDPLLLAARQLVRVAVALVGQVDELEELADALADLRPSGCLRTRSPNPMLSATVMFGNRAYDWKTIPMLRRFGGRWVMSSPSIVIVPAVGCSKPAIIRRVVVLPQPDGPRNDTNSPFSAARLKSSTATVVAEPLLDALEDEEAHRWIVSVRWTRRIVKDCWIGRAISGRPPTWTPPWRPCRVRPRNAMTPIAIQVSRKLIRDTAAGS